MKKWLVSLIILMSLGMGVSEGALPIKPSLTNMPSVTQQGYDCGIWAACNAAAIYKLVKNKQEATVGAVQALSSTLARQFIKNHNHFLTSDEIEEIGKVIKVPLTILGKQNGEIVPLNGALVMKASLLNKDPLDYYKYILRSLKLVLLSKGDCVVPFVCNLGNNHWIALVLVRTGGNPPRIVSLDSVNGYSHETLHYSNYIERVFFDTSYLGKIGALDLTLFKIRTFFTSCKATLSYPFRYIISKVRPLKQA